MPSCFGKASKAQSQYYMNSSQLAIDGEQEKVLNCLHRLFTQLLHNIKITSLQKCFMD